MNEVKNKKEPQNGANKNDTLVCKKQAHTQVPKYKNIENYRSQKMAMQSIRIFFKSSKS